MSTITLKEAEQYLESIYNTSRDTIIPYLRGPAGIGKTTIVHNLADKHDVNIVELICSQITYTELSGMPMPNNEDRSMDIYDNKKLRELKDGDILFLDEFDKADSTVKSAVLKLLQERQLMSGRSLPNIMIVAAGNPTELIQTVDECVRDRFFYLDIKFDSKKWLMYIENKYQIRLNTDFIACLDIKTDDDSSDTWNEITPRTAEKLIKYYLDNKNETAESFITTITAGRVFVNYVKEALTSMDTSNEIISLLKANKDIDKNLIKELTTTHSSEWKSIIDKHEQKELVYNILSKDKKGENNEET